ncbi:MAG: hypothetical protein GY788_28860, partial [bacterium]|nr:hypothetical protein [bacterium]
MKKAITGGITLNLIAGIVITVVTVVAAIFWMSARQNDQAAKSTQTMVVGGVEAMGRRVQSLANDYAWWQDFYDAYVGGDSEWMVTNIASSVEETEIADLMAVASPAGEVLYGWVLEEDMLPSDIVTPSVMDGIRELTRDMPVDPQAARSSFIDTGRSIMLIAVSRVAPVYEEDKQDPATLPYFIVGITLTADALRDLGKSFLIDDLRIESEPFPESELAADSTPIVDMAGTTIGYFVWTPPTPGFAVLRSIFLPVAIALVLFCVIAF